MPYPTTTAAAMPTTAPRAARPVSLDAWKVARRKTEVSKPSLRTARNAMPASAHAVPRPRAADALASSSRPRCRAWLRIQTIIPVTNTTATMPMSASMASCCACGSACSTAWSPSPTAMLRSTATPTPVHIGASGTRFRRRNAAMIPTIRVASRPSRRPMTSVASMTKVRLT
ncbi:hypothetical protein DEJ36_05450 [Curtobacterium sp. MCPF17_052]|nr:hypothetical protein [Curtobacterium sp. MCPF17_052]WIB13297.1 hypothetical protein DEJ36_05450 [Curtobacterium sp. MCPF17_052]